MQSDIDCSVARQRKSETIERRLPIIKYNVSVAQCPTVNAYTLSIFSCNRFARRVDLLIVQCVQNCWGPNIDAPVRQSFAIRLDDYLKSNVDRRAVRLECEARKLHYDNDSTLLGIIGRSGKAAADDALRSSEFNH